MNDLYEFTNAKQADFAAAKLQHRRSIFCGLSNEQLTLQKERKTKSLHFKTSKFAFFHKNKANAQSKI